MMLNSEMSLARQEVSDALTASNDRAIRNISAGALARAGDIDRAQKWCRNWRNISPLTRYSTRRIPTTQAISSSSGIAPKGDCSLEAGVHTIWARACERSRLQTHYIRGRSVSMAGDGTKAAAEYQKILDHKGVDPTTPLYMLSRLGLGRALALQGETAKAKTAYQDFLAAWKDADPDIPILKEAKGEYAKLQ